RACAAARPDTVARACALPGDDRAAVARPGLEAGDVARLLAVDARLGARGRGRGRGRAVRRARLAARPPGTDRDRARPPPPAGGPAGALRRLLLLLRGPRLPAGAAGLLARPPPRQPAGRVRAALRPARLPGRGRGLRGLPPRRQDAAHADREAAHAFPAHERDR